MAWTSPATPVSGTVITVSFWNTNARDNLNHLRLMTGNADPPGTNYVVVSLSTAGASWQKIPGDAIAAGTIASNNIGDQQIVMSKIQRFGANTVLRGNGAGTDAAFGQVLLADIAVGPGSQVLASDGSQNLWSPITSALLASDAVTEPKLDASNAPNDDQVLSYDSGTGRFVWTYVVPANILSEAVTEPKLDVSNAPNDDQVLCYDSGTGRMFWSYILEANIFSNAVTAGKVATGAITAGKIDANAVTEAKLDVDNSPSDTNLLSYVAGSGRMRWVAAPSVAASVPSGLIAFFSGAAALAAASGWSAYTAAAGRLLAATGSVFGQTFADGGDYGSSWDHVHVTNTFTGSTGTGTSGGPSAVGGLATAGAVSLPTATHTHSVPSLSVSVTGNTEAATYVPPLHSLPMGQKS